MKTPTESPVSCWAPVHPLPSFWKVKLRRKDRVTEGVMEVDGVTERKEETPPVVTRLHLRLACQHLETKRSSHSSVETGVGKMWPLKLNFLRYPGFDWQPQGPCVSLSSSLSVSLCTPIHRMVLLSPDLTVPRLMTEEVFCHQPQQPEGVWC